MLFMVKICVGIMNYDMTTYYCILHMFLAILYSSHNVSLYRVWRECICIYTNLGRWRWWAKYESIHPLFFQTIINMASFFRWFGTSHGFQVLNASQQYWYSAHLIKKIRKQETITLYPCNVAPKQLTEKLHMLLTPTTRCFFQRRPFIEWTLPSCITTVQNTLKL